MTRIEELVMKILEDLATIKTRVDALPTAVELHLTSTKAIATHARNCAVKKGMSKALAAVVSAITAVAGALVTWLATH